MDLTQYSADALLRDHTQVHIRAICPDDKQKLLDTFHRLTGRSIYFRFFEAKQELTKDELRFYTEIDYEHHFAIVATIIIEGKECIVGIGRCIEEKDSQERIAEVAFAVDDEHQNLGLGTLLFEHIVAIAQNKGITKLEADVLLSNKKMLELFQHSGFDLEITTESAVEHLEFCIDGKIFNKYYIE